jgi:hypothetical protein
MSFELTNKIIESASKLASIKDIESFLHEQFNKHKLVTMVQVIIIQRIKERLKK